MIVEDISRQATKFYLFSRAQEDKRELVKKEIETSTDITKLFNLIGDDPELQDLYPLLENKVLSSKDHGLVMELYILAFGEFPTQKLEDFLLKNPLALIDCTKPSRDKININIFLPRLMEILSMVDNHISAQQWILLGLKNYHSLEREKLFNLIKDETFFKTWKTFLNIFPEFANPTYLAELEHNIRDVSQLSNFYCKFYIYGANLESILSKVKPSQYGSFFQTLKYHNLTNMLIPYFDSFLGWISDQDIIEWINDIPALVQKYQKYLQETNDEEEILSNLVHMNGFDIGSYTDFIIKSKNLNDYLGNFIVAFKRLNEDQQKQFIKQIPVFENIALQNNDSNLIKKLITSNIPGFRFPTLKNKYNQLIEDKYKYTTEYVESIFNNRDCRGMYTYTQIDEYIKLTQSKKDFFAMDFECIFYICRPIVFNYVQNKQKTLVDLYHETIKSNFPLIGKLNLIYMSAESAYRTEITDLLVLADLAHSSTNFGHYVKLVKKTTDIAELMHDTGIDVKLARLAVFHPFFNSEDVTHQEILEVINSYRSVNPDQLFDKLSNNKELQKLINVEQFKSNLQQFQHVIDMFYANQQFITSNEIIKIIKRLHTDISIIEDFQVIQELISKAKPKIKDMEKFNHTINDFEFKVLDYLDPYTFRVGVDTDCCQRIGGVGEQAAIDSFINPLAGVIVLTYQGTIISQSYFHYVPNDFGLILDNVEWNEHNLKILKLTQLNLTKLYAEYAKKIKDENPEIKYIKCGKDYNKLNNEMFNSSLMKDDPRHFEIDKDNVYSDFDTSNHLDLLNPTPQLNLVSVPSITSKPLQINASSLKTSTIRQWWYSNLLCKNIIIQA